MKLALAKGSTNVTVNVFVQDSSSTTGAGLTGLVYNSSGLTCYYVRPLAAAAVQALVTQTVTGAHTDGGFVEIDATNMPGWYRLDLKDAICATGVDHVGLLLQGATNMAPVPLEIQLTDVDLNDGVRAGLTALPNAAADAAGGLATSAGGATGIDDLATSAALATAQADLDTLTGLDGATLATSQPNYAPALASVATEARLSELDAGTIGKMANQVDEIRTDTGEIGAAGAGLTNLGGMSATMKAQVNAEVDTALNTAIPLTPTADSINERIAAIDDLTQAGGAGDLAAVLTDTANMQPKLGTPAADLAADIAAVQADTDNIQSRIPAALSGGNMKVDVIAVSGSTEAADKLEAHALLTLPVTFSAGGTTTTAVLNQVDGAAASSTDDVYIGRVLIFDSGSLATQPAEITDYVGATKTATISAVTASVDATHTAKMI